MSSGVCGLYSKPYFERQLSEGIIVRERVAMSSLSEVPLQRTIVFLHFFLGGLHFALEGLPRGSKSIHFLE